MTLSPEIYELAGDISLADLLLSPLSRDATIRAIRSISSSMFLKTEVTRTPDEQYIENTLTRIRFAIPRDVRQAAYQAGFDEHEMKKERGLISENASYGIVLR